MKLIINVKFIDLCYCFPLDGSLNYYWASSLVKFNYTRKCVHAPYMFWQLRAEHIDSRWWHVMAWYYGAYQSKKYMLKISDEIIGCDLLMRSKQHTKSYIYILEYNYNNASSNQMVLCFEKTKSKFTSVSSPTCQNTFIHQSTCYSTCQ